MCEWVPKSKAMAFSIRNNFNFSFIADISEVGHPDHGEEKPSHKDVK